MANEPVVIQSQADAMDVVNNSANPHHSALHSGDSSVKAAVEAALARANPELAAQIRNEQQFSARAAGDKIAEGAIDPSQSGEQPPAGSYEPTEAEVEVRESLTLEWGDQYQTNMNFGGRAMRAVFPTEEHAEKFAQQAGLYNNPELYGKLMRLAVEIGKSMK